MSARYEAQAVANWLANLSLTSHYQRAQRLLQNFLPVQFADCGTFRAWKIAQIDRGLSCKTVEK